MVFEFVVAAVIFFAVVFYTINYLNSGVSAFSGGSYVNNLEIRAIQISELLVHDPGVWEDSTPKIVGLSKEWPVLNMTKIQLLDGFCNYSANYTYLLQNLGLEESRFGSRRIYNVSIKINEGDNVLLDCGLNPPEKMMVNVERFALSEGDKILTVNVWVW